jgi:enamine deaminase RidA (YjgF/YER057c/UK114 family)
MSLELMNPDGLSTPPTYSHVAIARGTRVVFLAGQVAFDADGNLVGEGDVVAQARQAYRNVATALEAAGASIADVAKLTTFVVGHRPELIEPIMAARGEVLGGHKPASTYLGVESLARPGLLVEVEAIAVLD